MIRVLLADDHALLRESLRETLDRQQDMEVIGEASNGEEAVQLAIEYKPDIVLMDLKMKGLDGVEATRAICSCCPDVRVIAVTMYRNSGLALQALKAGANGYFLKESSPSELIQAIRKVYRGEVSIHESIAGNLVAELRRLDAAGPTQRGVILTDKEVTILQLVAQGKKNSEIAQQLSLAESTIKNKLTIIYQKLGVKSRTEAMARACQLGWIAMA